MYYKIVNVKYSIFPVQSVKLKNSIIFNSLKEISIMKISPK